MSLARKSKLRVWSSACKREMACKPIMVPAQHKTCRAPSPCYNTEGGRVKGGSLLWGKGYLEVPHYLDEDRGNPVQSGGGPAQLQAIRVFSGDCNGVLEPIQK